MLTVVAMKLITTESSRYLLDEDAETVTRYPGSASETANWPIADLRLDGEEIKLISFVEPVIGQPMLLLLDVRRDGVVTARYTTPVLSVEVVRYGRED